ncbi:carbohydrate ABC transporter permease [Paenibacillus sp. MCAF20]
MKTYEHMPYSPSIGNASKKPKWLAKLTPGYLLSHILLIVLSLFFIFPFYWIVTGAFKVQNVAVAIPPEWFPLEPTLDNFVSFVPLFTMIADFGWIDHYKSLILPAIGWPFGIFLVKQFAQTLPGELLEAAKMDGCSELRLYYSIVLPLLKPALGALAIFTFINAWNDYFSQLIMIRSTPMMTLPLGVATLKGEYTTPYGVLMAGAAFASIPMIAIFLLLQKAFTQGITMGAVKG